MANVSAFFIKEHLGQVCSAPQTNCQVQTTDIGVFPMSKKSFLAFVAFLALLFSYQTSLASEKSKTVTIQNNYTAYLKKEKRGQPDNQKAITEQLKVPYKPKKVIVFDMGALDTLTALGVEKSVAGIPKGQNAVNLLPDNLKKIYQKDAFQNVGSLFEPNFETIASIQPEIIFLGARMASVDNLTKLKEAAPKAAIVYGGIDAKKPFDQAVEERLEMFGRIYGKKKKAKAYQKKLTLSLKRLKKSVKAKKNPTALFVMANSAELLTQSPAGRFGWIYQVAGFVPVNKEEKLSTHGSPVSYEYISEKNPDYLFVLDRGATLGQAASAKKLLANDVIKESKAVKLKHVHEVDGRDWYINAGGIRVTLRMIADLQDFLDKN